MMIQKSKIKTIHIVLVVFLLCSACSAGNNRYPWNIVEQERIITSDDDLFLRIKGGTETSSGLIYEIHNRTAEQISYGPEFQLEIKVDDKWYLIENEMGWEAYLIFMEADTMEDYVIDWSDFYGELPGGKYRLVKGVKLSGEYIYLADEFWVE